MKITPTACALLILVLCLGSVHGAEIGSFLDRDRVEITGANSDGVVVRAVMVISRPPGFGGQGWRWGSEGSAPAISMGQLDVYLGVNRVFVPISAYSDLGNPRSSTIETADKGFQIVVRGGDAATSYKATLVFEGGLLRSRKVVNGEFPDEAWEETIYSFNVRRE